MKRTAMPGPLARLPFVDTLAKRHLESAKKAVFDSFARSEADIYITYQAPNPALARIRKLRGPLIYDCVDFFEGFGDDKSIGSLEAGLCDRADAIWVVSTYLQDKLSRWSRKVTLVPNGVDFDHFAKARTLRDTRRAAASYPSRPVLIYVGAVSHWFNAELLGDVADLLGDWDIRLVGPSDLAPGQSRHLNRSNIRRLGVKDYSLLPELLAQADVAMIPFKINELIKGTSPIKLYEYLAASLPVVATPMPEVLPYVEDGVVACADSAADFARSVRSLQGTAKDERRQMAARLCSWQSRFAPPVAAMEQQLQTGKLPGGAL